ncbi:MAG TPA: cyclic nucleotide-binding domain-containing protein [Thiolinea sp.]|nr:cyclic nucleotide-binding domain-containing protein [Thiolinea sp.]
MSNDDLIRQVQDTCAEFCAALTQDEVSKFVHYMRSMELGANEMLADIGDVGASFYLVIGGSIQLFQVDGHAEYAVGVISPGGLVGEMSFFDRRPRTVRLKTGESGAQLLEIKRQMYSRLRIEEPYISTNLLEFVIRSLDELVRELSAKHADLKKLLDN